MPKSDARFRLSIKDNKTRTGIKFELIDAPGLWGEPRYRLRLNGREPDHVEEVTLTEVFDRLRLWLVKRAVRISNLFGTTISQDRGSPEYRAESVGGDEQ